MAAKSIIIFISLFTFYRSSVVYSQVPDSLYFGTTSPQVRVRNDLGQGVSSQQYTVYGWYRFSGETESISNILTMANEIQQTSTTPSSVEFYPQCPYPPETLNSTPSLWSSPEVSANPNCAASLSNLVQSTTSGPPLLYINYDLAASDFSLLFLVQAGVAADGSSQMVIQGFPQRPLAPGIWTFFAVSADYAAGNIFIFAKQFDGTSAPLSQSFAVSYKGFELRQNFEVVLASVQTNPYFESVSGFIGNIAAVEVALMFTEAVEALWLGYLTPSSQAFSGVLMDLAFDVYSAEDLLVARGSQATNLAVQGGYSPLFLTNRNAVGVKFASDAGVALTGLNFANADRFIKSYTFFFSFQYAEPLPDPFVLISGGSTEGAIEFSLKKVGAARRLTIAAAGSGGGVSRTAGFDLPADTQLRVVAGLVFSPGGSAHSVYWDSMGGSEVATLAESFAFAPTAGGPALVFLGNNQTPSAGSITFLRLTALQSASTAVLNHLLGPGGAFSSTCSLATSFYASDTGCLLCRVGLATPAPGRCAAHCPQGSKNALSGLCVPCRTSNCSEIDSTRFSLSRIDDGHFLITPSRPLGPFALTPGLFSISVGNLKQEDFSYMLNASPVNDSIHLRLNYTANAANAPLTVRLNQDPSNPVFDSNGNLIYAVEASDLVVGVCAQPIKGIEIFAKVIAILLLASLAVILLAAALCRSRSKNSLLGSVTPRFNYLDPTRSALKYWFLAWTKGQVAASFALFGLATPCCISAFIDGLFSILISWNFALGKSIDSSRANDLNYTKERFGRGLPSSFNRNGVAPFFILNFGVALIIHAVFLLIFGGLKLWDCRGASKGGWLYRLFVLFEFSAMITIFTLVTTQIFLFAGVNFTNASLNDPLFVISLILAAIYLAGFLLFAFYTGLKLCTRSYMNLAPFVINRFFACISGHRPAGFAHLYDLAVQLLVAVAGLMIGLLYSAPVAQTAVVVAVILVWLGVLAGLRPSTSWILFIGEVISVLALAVSAILFLVLAVYQNNGCIGCSDLDSEGKFCHAVIAMLALVILAPLVALFVFGIQQICCGFFEPREPFIPNQQMAIADSRAYESRNYLIRNNQFGNGLYIGESKEEFGQIPIEVPLATGYNYNAYGMQYGQGIQPMYGVQGAQDVNIIQGIQGVQGVQDMNIIQGIQGVQGVQGVQDMNIIQGAQGMQNIQGVNTMQMVQNSYNDMRLNDMAANNMRAGGSGLLAMERDYQLTEQSRVEGLRAPYAVGMAEANRLERDAEDERLKKGSFSDLPVYGEAGSSAAGTWGTSFVHQMHVPPAKSFNPDNTVMEADISGISHLRPQNVRVNNFFEKENEPLNFSITPSNQPPPMREDPHSGQKEPHYNYLASERKTNVSSFSQQI